LQYTAYFDEADTHGPSPTMILAGFLGAKRQWKLFGRRLRKLQREYGFTIFHAAEVGARSGEFDRWPVPKCMALLHENWSGPS
jgi:hypothetical protein